MKNTIVINGTLDLFFATELMNAHKAELPTQITERAKNYNKSVIAEIEAEIAKFNLNNEN